MQKVIHHAEGDTPCKFTSGIVYAIESNRLDRTVPSARQLDREVEYRGACIWIGHLNLTTPAISCGRRLRRELTADRVLYEVDTDRLAASRNHEVLICEGGRDRAG